MPARYRVEFSPRAENDLEEIAFAIAADSPANALRFVAKLRAATKKLSSLPMRASRAPEGVIDGKTVHHLLVDNYRILFTVEGREVHIEGVRHSSMLPLGE